MFTPFLRLSPHTFPACLATTVSGDSLAQALQSLSVEDVLLPVLIQLAVIILVARMAAVLARKLGQPGVVGEIAAGVILGPSVLGYFAPEVANFIFHPVPHAGQVSPVLFDALLNWIFNALSQLGLILLLFLVGLEFEFGHLKSHGRSALGISLAGILLPFLLGAGVAVGLLPLVEVHPVTQSKPEFVSFCLFLGTALSITALPVLGRMMMELNITRSRIGTITITAAALDDAFGWILLATVSALVKGRLEWAETLRMIGLTLLFVAVMLLVVKPLLGTWVRKAVDNARGELAPSTLAMLLVVVFLCAICTNLIGIFAIFGAFLCGVILSSEEAFRLAITRRLRDMVTVFFMPIFFTYTGLRTNIGSLSSAELWGMCGVVLVTAIAGKVCGCSFAAWVSGFPRREAACVGTMMNTRGLMELVVVNVGYQLHIIPPSVYCMLVIMALVTTIMTTPLLMRLYRTTELEPYIQHSTFLLGDHPTTLSRTPLPPLAKPARNET